MERALHAIEKPVTDEEAQLMVTCFEDDDCFGLAWALLHLVGSAPSPLVASRSPDGANARISRLWMRYRNSLAR